MTTRAEELAKTAAEYLSCERTFAGRMTAADIRRLTRDALTEVAKGLDIADADVPAAVDEAIKAATEPAAS